MDDDIYSLAPIEYFALQNNQTTEIWNRIMNEEIIRPTKDNILLYIIEVLKQEELESKYYTTDTLFNYSITSNSSQSTISLDIDKASNYSIKIIDINNNIIHSLEEKNKVSGKYEYIYNLSPGIYIVHIRFNNDSYTKKIII